MRPALGGLQAHAGESDRVRAHSPASVNAGVDREVQECLAQLANADRAEIDEHLHELDREWDVERYLQMNAGLVSLAGVVLGAAVDKRFLCCPPPSTASCSNTRCRAGVRRCPSSDGQARARDARSTGNATR